MQLEREAEAKRKLDAENAPGVAPAPAAAPAAPSGREDRPSSQDEFNNWRQSGAPATAHKPAEADTGSRVNLTAINEHFAPIQLTSVGLAQLGFEPVATVKASKLYRACDLPAMAAALISHLHALEAVPA